MADVPLTLLPPMAESGPGFQLFFHYQVVLINKYQDSKYTSHSCSEKPGVSLLSWALRIIAWLLPSARNALAGSFLA